MDFKIVPPFERRRIEGGGDDGNLVAGAVQRGGFAEDAIIEVQVVKGDHTDAHGLIGRVGE